MRRARTSRYASGCGVPPHPGISSFVRRVEIGVSQSVSDDLHLSCSGVLATKSVER
jgi:hypothetical protein